MKIKSFVIDSFFVAVVLFLSLNTYAQKLGIPEIQNFNRGQYDGAMQNWKVSQSNYDIMYFANSDGLLEYDGVSWRLHQEMNDSRVRCVECINDKIYAGAVNDFGYFQYDSLQHFRYTSLATTNKLRSLGDVWAIHEWNGKVVFQTTLAIVIVSENLVESVIWSTSRYYSSFLVNGLLLVDDEQEGLMEVRGDTTYLVSGGEFFAGKYVSSIIAISDREMMIGTLNKGAFLWDAKKIKVWNESMNHYFIKNNLNCGIRYDKDHLLFGTIQNGLIVTNNKGDLVMQIDKDKGLKNNTVLGVFIDKEKGVWCALDNGIARVSLNTSITFLTGYYNIGTGYTQDYYKDKCYFGTNQALFSIGKEKLKDPLKDRNDFKKIIGTEGQVWFLFHDEDNLLCGHNLGLFRIIDGRSERITPPFVKGVWNIKTIKGRPDLLICGTYSGLILLNKVKGEWSFKRYISGLENPTHFLEWDHLGHLWVSNDQKEVACLSFSENYESIIDIENICGDSSSEQNAQYVTQIQNLTIIAGCDGLQFVNKEGKLERYSQLDNFFKKGNYPVLIREDRFQNLWMFYLDKLSVLRYLEDGSYKKIDLPFIPLSKKLVTGFESIYVLDQRNVFFSVEDGFAHYLLQDYQNFKVPIHVHLRSFKGQSDSVEYVLNQGSNNNFRQAHIPKYPYGNNAFDLHYSSTFYGDKEMEYSTKLSSVDQKFSRWTETTFRQLSNLKEGDYNFTIKARNRYGVESKPLSFSFTILAPWYRHSYARLVYIILILLFVFFLVLIVNKRIEKSRQQEKLKQRERFKEKEKFLTNEALKSEKEMIKMRNDKLRSDVLYKEKELANSTMNIIQKNEFLGIVKEHLKKIKKRTDATSEIERQIGLLIKKIDKDLDTESYWEVFEVHLEQVHSDFLKRLNQIHPSLTSKEQKLSAYIRMGMSSKEIASLMNISSPAVDNIRYRLRQKLGIEQGGNLIKYINQV